MALTISQHLQLARENKITNPRLQFGPYLFKLAKASSANPGCVYVTLKETGNYLGKILANGTDWAPIRGIHPDCNAGIVKAMADPLEAAKVHGQRTGTCCVCGRTLFAGVSIAAMIGPICSEKYGFDQYEIAVNNGYTGPTVSAANTDVLSLDDF